jgi:galactose oxidase-like protein
LFSEGVKGETMNSNRTLTQCLSLIAVAVVILGLKGSTAAQTWIELLPIGGPSGNILGRQPAGSGYDAVNNRLILYFPSNPFVAGFSSEVWVLTNANGLGGSPVWTQLISGGTPPNNVNGGESAVYDGVSNRLIVYGGCFANCSPAQSTVYTLTNANGLGGPPVWLTSSVTNPQARDEQSAVYDSANNLMIAFAGGLAFFGTNQNDTRVLSSANGLTSPSTWSTLLTAGGPPGAREAHTATYDQANNRMTVFGGTHLITTCCPYVINDYNDVWVLSNANGFGGTPTWTQLLPPGDILTPRSTHSAVYDSINNRTIIFGGLQWNQTAQSYKVLSDLWQLSNANGLGGTPTWTQLSPTGTAPGPTYSHTAAFDTTNQRMIVFGGADESFATNNRVWVLVFNQAPVAMCQDVTVTTGAGVAANASIDNGSFDLDNGDTITLSQSPSGPYPIGQTNVTLRIEDNHGASSSCQAVVTVLYDYSGFFQPVDNLPVVNLVNAGSAIPVKFSLNGNKGQNIFEAGYPISQQIACGSGAPISTVEETLTVGNTSLSYDSRIDQYIYVWKTEKGWKGTCRQLIVRLVDGSSRAANFQFK